MTVLFLLLLVVALLGIGVVTRDLPSRSRLALAGIATALFFLGLALGLERGRIGSAHEEAATAPAGESKATARRMTREAEAVRTLSTADPRLPLDDRERALLEQATRRRREDR